MFDCDIAAFDITGFLQALTDSAEPSIILVGAAEQADQRHCRLPARRERPRRSAAKQRDELAPNHSIISSARASSVGGTSRPSALAVFRLIVRSNFTGACTGRSAGFSPLSMRST